MRSSWPDVLVPLGPGLGATAPAAVLAAVVALARFAVSALDPAHARTVLVVGSVVAAAGAAVVAPAPRPCPSPSPGLVLAAAGTGALFPTLLSIVSRNVVEAPRGRATSVVTVVSYLGFLLGPGGVGLWASATGLRGAMIAVAALGRRVVHADSDAAPPHRLHPRVNRTLAIALAGARRAASAWPRSR